MTFRVQKAACSTCIYRKDSPLDIETLEAEIADGYGGFNGFRECHHAEPGSGVCCRGFWGRHRDRFAAGQIAQRLGLVEFVEVDVLEEATIEGDQTYHKAERRKERWDGR